MGSQIKQKKLQKSGTLYFYKIHTVQGILKCLEGPFHKVSKTCNFSNLLTQKKIPGKIISHENATLKRSVIGKGYAQKFEFK